MANWTIEERRQIWNKGQFVPGYDPAIWRKDQCGAFIKWDKYGDRSDRYNNASRQNGRLICPIKAKEE